MTYKEIDVEEWSTEGIKIHIGISFECDYVKLHEILVGCGFDQVDDFYGIRNPIEWET